MKPTLHMVSRIVLSYFELKDPHWESIALNREVVYFEPCDEVYAVLGDLLNRGIAIHAVPLYETTVIPNARETFALLLTLNIGKAVRVPDGFKVTFNRTK